MKVRRGYATVSFGQVHYRFGGTPGKPIVVLLHQTPSTSEMYEDLMQALLSDYRLFAPDTPGMGLSDSVADQSSIAALANGIAEFLDEVGIDRCSLFGHHTGAAIAVELAAKQPQRFDTLALSGPTLLDDELRDRLPALASQIPASDDGAHLLKMWQRISAKDVSAPPAIIERETLSAVRLGPRYAAAYDAVMKQDLAAALARLACPVLVFAGTRDPLYGQLDEAVRLLKDGRSASIDDARTFVCETHTPDVARLLLGFFPGAAA